MSSLTVNVWSNVPGSLNVMVLGGTAPYTVHVAGNTYNLSKAGVLYVPNLVAGSYSVSCVDSVGTSAQSSSSIAVQGNGSVGYAIPSSNTAVDSFVGSVAGDMSYLLPTAVSVLSVMVAVRIIPWVVSLFMGSVRS